VIEHWFCKDWIYPYLLEKALDDPREMYKLSTHFASKSRSGGIMAGIIGALDGWLVKIRCPSLKRDNVRNPATYFSRKGFYALNVQVIVDRYKRVIWRCIGAKGSEHDSKAFKTSSLYARMMAIFEDINGKMHSNLLNLKFYLIGDSAYSLRPFLLKPYDNAAPGSSEDVFNFMLSSSRIFVECTFGAEIDARWGILWRPLQYNLDRHKFIIDACMRLHNFLVDYREEHGSERWEEDMEFYSAECLSFCTANPDIAVGIYGNGSQGEGATGRPSNRERDMRDKGIIMRDALRDLMKKNNLERCNRTWSSNACNHVVNE
jgi:hypothetical protein